MTPALPFADGSFFHGTAIMRREAVGKRCSTPRSRVTRKSSLIRPTRQIVTLTFPHIGNVGCNAVDEVEADSCGGTRNSRLPRLASNWRSSEPLDAPCAATTSSRLPISTRAADAHLRDQGAQNACPIAGAEISVERALASARSRGSWLDLAIVHQVDVPIRPRQLRSDRTALPSASAPRLFMISASSAISRRRRSTAVAKSLSPAQTSAVTLAQSRPVCFPMARAIGALHYAIAAARIYQAPVPLFVSRPQILFPAAGAQTVKMKFDITARTTRSTWPPVG